MLLMGELSGLAVCKVGCKPTAKAGTERGHSVQKVLAATKHDDS